MSQIPEPARKYVDLGGIAHGIAQAQHRVKHHIVVTILHKKNDELHTLPHAFHFSGTANQMGDLQHLEAFHKYIHKAGETYNIIGALVHDARAETAQMKTLKEIMPQHGNGMGLKL